MFALKKPSMCDSVLRALTNQQLGTDVAYRRLQKVPKRGLLFCQAGLPFFAKRGCLFCHGYISNFRESLELVARGDVSAKERPRSRERNAVGKVGGTFRAPISTAASAENKKDACVGAAARLRVKFRCRCGCSGF